MSTGTSLDEKFEAIMKKYQSLLDENEILIRKINEDAQHDQELKAQNEYLRRQMGEFIKQSKRCLLVLSVGMKMRQQAIL